MQNVTQTSRCATIPRTKGVARANNYQKILRTLLAGLRTRTLLCTQNNTMPDVLLNQFSPFSKEQRLLRPTILSTEG